MEDCQRRDTLTDEDGGFVVVVGQETSEQKEIEFMAL
jgi:hypothetical protein